MAKAGEVSVIIRAVDKTKAVVDKTQSRFSKFTEKLKSLSLVQIGALSGVAYSFQKLVEGASDIVEAQNKAEVVFGKASTKIVEFAKKQATQFGFTTAEAMEYAGTLGQILTASGLSEDAAVEMSIKLEKLAADLASINNIPVADALQKIRAGLVGEAEPLRTVGVLLSEQEIKRKAVAAGIAKEGEQLTQAQKVLARYLTIMDQTKKIQGDFQRTSGELANSTRILTKQIKDELSKAMVNLLPVVKTVVTFLRQMVGWFAKLPSPVKTVVVALGGLIIVMKTLGLSLTSLAGPVGIFLALMGLVGGILLNTKLKTEEARNELIKFQQTVATMSLKKAQDELTEMQQKLAQLREEEKKLREEREEQLKQTKRISAAGGVAKIRITPEGMAETVERLRETQEQIQVLTEKMNILKEHIENTKNYQDQLNESIANMATVLPSTDIVATQIEQQQQMKAAALEKEVSDYITRMQEKYGTELQIATQAMAIWSARHDKMEDIQHKKDLIKFYQTQMKKNIYLIQQDIKRWNRQKREAEKHYSYELSLAQRFAMGAASALSGAIVGQGIQWIDKAWERSFGKANSLLEQFANNFLKTAMRLATNAIVRTLFSSLFPGIGLFGGFFHTGGIIRGIHRAQTGLTVGADIVPVLASPGEAIIPAQSVRENREVVQQLITQQTVTNEGAETNVNLEVNVSIQSWDGEDVMRVVNSDKFRDAMKNAIQNRIINFRVKGKGLEIA